MRLWRQVVSGLRSLFRRTEADRDLEDEVEHYIDEAVAELVASGVDPVEARRAVRLRYGDALAAREEVRSFGWESTVAAVWTDVRIATRRLVRDPGFSVVAVLTLGLGIGATTAIFSVVRPVLFDPLPYPDADRIVAVADRADDGSVAPVTFGSFQELHARSGSFAALAVYKPWQPTSTGGEEAERLEGQRVSAEYFDVLGVQPLLGRSFDPTADHPGGPDVVVVSYGLWQRRFASDPSVVGSTVQLDSQPFTVVGVMPPGFENATSYAADVWALLQYDPAAVSFDTREWGHHLDMIGRVKTGVSVDQAEASLAAIANTPVPEFVRPVWATLAQGLVTRRLREASTAQARPMSLVLMGAVALLLTIACVNLTILLLARGARRRGELALRAALGARWPRLVRSLLTESLLLAGAGAAVGLLVARAGRAGLVAVSPPTLRLAAVDLDPGAFAVAVAVPTLVALFFGVTPAIAGTRPGAARSSARGSVHHAHPARRALVVTEVALAVILLVGAGLLLRSTQNLFSISPGFDPSRTVVLQISTTGLGRGDATTEQFFDEALEAVRVVPGVEDAALTSQLPLSGDVDMYGVTLVEEGRSEAADGSAYRYAVSPGYFDAMSIPVVGGRGLDPRDGGDAEPVAVVSESLARRLFAGTDPVGSLFHFGAVTEPAFRVVGVVGDVKQESLGTAQADAVYIASRQWHWADRVRWLVVRAARDPGAIVTPIRQAIRGVDPNQPIVRVQAMSELVARSEAQRRFVAIVLGAFALSALTLAGIGLFGVLSGSVTERAREIGVRGALGASRSDIVGLVIRNGMAMTGLGVAIGVAVATLASETLVSLLFGVSRLDAATYLSVLTLLSLVSALACWIPATRAARMDPVATLKAD